MKRLITLLIVILALIAGAGRTEVAVTTDCTLVSAEIKEEQESTAETPAEAAVSPVLPIQDAEAIDAKPCETEPETTDCAPLPEPVMETETERGDGGDRVTAEKDIEKTADPAVTEPKETLEATTESEPSVIPDVITSPVIVPNELAVEISTDNDTDAEQQGGNAPIFIDPCRGGPNPFDDDTPSVIDDHNSDEFVGDGDRPGEGIHF